MVPVHQLRQAGEQLPLLFPTLHGLFRGEAGEGGVQMKIGGVKQDGQGENTS